ncbi:GNAT family N-acetyltransferase [Terribacillus saccharophilus]|uniref:GNAT family N-acetyltransferase n=1 Tax=Terribacillus saccharophilus TaxID=361277 RepID=A0ABX4H2Q9_9BACI|nr:GNAT family N-acetyltransferase [Terribacillus saccharophilus]PAD37135.1 GNAT family N-acetyltransferase [Terribacillus saccharophilus]PAD97379.1 GNAT family N-acetyltransferase [Terribacillus saccharophilus]PAE01427.1 GNAT family N-acetyltransferase [Terribacillus saccharophilus]
MSVIIEQFTMATNSHYELLLDADPSRKIVDSYLSKSHRIEARWGLQIIGVIILMPTRPETLEIVNIAVNNDFQNQGIGRLLIEYALEYAREHKFKTVEIGTGSTSLGSLYLYQKCGFRMTHIDRDYFSRHYDEEIIENKIVLRDMVRMSQDVCY